MQSRWLHQHIPGWASPILDGNLHGSVHRRVKRRVMCTFRKNLQMRSSACLGAESSTCDGLPAQLQQIHSKGHAILPSNKTTRPPAHGPVKTAWPNAFQGKTSLPSARSSVLDSRVDCSVFFTLRAEVPLHCHALP